MGRVPDLIFCEIMGYGKMLREVKTMEQQSIVPYFTRKGLSPFAIHDDLVTTLGADAMNYSSVTHYLRDAGFSSSNQPTTLPNPAARLDDCDHAILLTLAEQPFVSIRE
jgi:hypothetical protein